MFAIVVLRPVDFRLTLLGHLSAMALGELLEADLARWAECVGTNDRLPADERAEIDTRELLGASWAKRRVKDVARRTLDGTQPAGRESIARSGHNRTVDSESWKGEFGMVLKSPWQVPISFS